MFQRIVDENIQIQVRQGVTSAAAHINAIYPLTSRLPVEILLSIFRLIPECAFRLSHVCKDWRTLAFSDAHLWQTVNITANQCRQPGLVAAVLSRSRMRSPSISIQIPKTGNNVIYGILRAHIGRARTMDSQN